MLDWQKGWSPHLRDPMFVRQLNNLLVEMVAPASQENQGPQGRFLLLRGLHLERSARRSKQLGM